MSNVTNQPHGKFVISHETLDRIEKITNTKVLRGMDFTLNMALDILEEQQCKN